MERLEVKNGKIVTASGKPVMLRGSCVGGWMNMENFINGYPGDESGTRMHVANVLGPAKGEFFFDLDEGGRAAKVYRNARKASVIHECEQSLRRLRTDRIDLLQCHWRDHTTPVEETMEALVELQQQKRDLVAGVLGAESSLGKTLTREDLEDLFSLED